MARLYSGRHGKSGSKKPHRAGALKWVTTSEKDIEKLVVELAKAGKEPAAIGLILRDLHGIPDVKKLTNKSITAIINENNLTPKIPSDISALMRHLAETKKHLSVHKHDMDAKRGTQLTSSKILRLSKYYRREGVLPKEWKPEQ